MALGALIIQARMQLPDRETVESIQENPHMQYFIGLSGFQQKPPFHHSMMTHFGKRLVHVLAEINEIIAAEGIERAKTVTRTMMTSIHMVIKKENFSRKGPLFFYNSPTRMGT